MLISLTTRYLNRGKGIFQSSRIDSFNFVCTADIIGGNSGSPVVNRKGQLVGLIFDGNIQSLTSNVIYSSRQARAVAVASRGLLEALSVVYKADHIVQEMQVAAPEAAR